MSEFRGFFDGSEKTSDDFLKKIILEGNPQIVSYGKVTHVEKNTITNEVINKALNLIRKKDELIDYTFVEKSKGNIENLVFYKDLEASIALLNTLYQKSNGTGSKHIPQLAECLMNLRHFRPNFEKGFSDGNKLIEILYNNVVVSLISATSWTIATTINYTRDSLNLWTVQLKKDNSLNAKNQMSLHLSNIEKFNEYSVKGYIVNYMNKSNIISMENGVPSNLVGEVLLGIGILLAVIFFLQQIIYLWFYARRFLAHQLRLLSTFVQLHAATINSPKLSDVKEKQEKIVNELQDLADKIDVGAKVSEKAAISDLKSDEKILTDRNTSYDGGIL